MKGQELDLFKTNFTIIEQAVNAFYGLGRGYNNIWKTIPDFIPVLPFDPRHLGKSTFGTVK